MHTRLVTWEGLLDILQFNDNKFTIRVERTYQEHINVNKHSTERIKRLSCGYLGTVEREWQE